MTEPVPLPGGHDDPIPPEFVRHRPPTRRQIGGRASFFWRWLFPLLTVGAVVAVPYLVVIGGRAVLDSEGSASLSAQVQDPTAPGYRAFVNPSATAIVVVLDQADEVVGAALFASAGDGGGGTIAVVARDVELPALSPEGGLGSDNGEAEESSVDEATAGGGKTVAEAWADGGADEVGERSAELLGIVVDQVIELRPPDVVVALGDADPLEYSFLDPLVDESGQELFGRGVVQLEAIDVPTVLAALGPNEADLNRSDRQVSVWQAWIAVAEPVDTDEPHGLAWFLHDLGRAASNVVLLPGNEGGPEDLVADIVPFPVLYRDVRPTVRLINEQRNPQLNRAAVEAIADAGGLPTVIGNPLVATGQNTRVDYISEDDREAAIAVGAALGTQIVELVPPEAVEDILLGGEFDIVVTLGLDYVAGAIGG